VKAGRPTGVGRMFFSRNETNAVKKFRQAAANANTNAAWANGSTAQLYTRKRRIAPVFFGAAKPPRGLWALGYTSSSETDVGGIGNSGGPASLERTVM
jgi:hypothetical protein